MDLAGPFFASDKYPSDAGIDQIQQQGLFQLLLPDNSGKGVTLAKCLHSFSFDLTGCFRARLPAPVSIPATSSDVTMSMEPP